VCKPYDVATSFLASVLRLGFAMRMGKPRSRLAQLPYVCRTMPMQARVERPLPILGNMHVPYLVDLNRDVAMFESAETHCLPTRNLRLGAKTR